MSGRRPGWVRPFAGGLASAGMLALFSLSGFAQQAPSPPRITFTKFLKGSIPEYEQVVVDSTGAATCDLRKMGEPPGPRALKLSAATATRIFRLASRLSDFRGIELESRKAVANLGWKTLTYETNHDTNRVEFNYTANRDAQELTEVFESVATVAMHMRTLEYSTKYDPLGLPRELSEIQLDLDRKALTDPELMVPQLEAIARDPRFLHLAQVRAQNILHELHHAGN